MKENFPVEISIDIKWGDMDALQHVNNTVFFKYFESTRIAHFDRFDLMESLSEKGLFPILAATTCKFLKPLRYPDTISCSSRISSVGNTSFIQNYRIIDGSGDLAAVGEGVVVIVNSETHSKTAIPPFLLDRIYELQPELKD